jgi:glycosyltransferase involved in cell wall biosynthesis
MRGFWADERIDGKIWDTTKFIYNVIYKHFKNLEKKYIANAAHIISLTEAGKKEMLSWKIFKHCSTPISVIPCCADLELFDYKRQSPQKKHAVRQELNISDNTFVLSYLGSFGTWYMNEEMFMFFAQLYRSNPNSCFLCITPDSAEMLYELAEQHAIPRSALRIIKATRKQVPHYASISNWSLFFIKPLYSKIASSPTKMGELLGLGIPLVCNAGVGDVEAIMKHCPQGACLHEFSAETYQKTIDYILQNPAVEPEALYNVAQEFYSLEKGVEAYVQVYEGIQ